MTILADHVRLSVLRVLCDLHIATTAEICQHCHCSDPTVRRHLEALETLGLVREWPGQRDGLTPGRPAKRFVLDAEAADRVCALFHLLSVPLSPTLAPEKAPPEVR